MPLSPRGDQLARLPGDVMIRRDGSTFLFPLATCLLLSAVLTGILWLVSWMAHGRR
jgi:hypothetical protein